MNSISRLTMWPSANMSYRKGSIPTTGHLPRRTHNLQPKKYRRK